MASEQIQGIKVKFFPLMVSAALISGCSLFSDKLVESHGPLEDRNRKREFAELDKQAKQMQKSITSARRDAAREARR